MACDTSTLLTNACTYGYAGLSDRDLKIATLVLLCDGGAGGGGGEGGSGDPEGVVTAAVGTTYVNTDDNSFWVKTSGTGNTGWTELIA